MSFKNDVLGLLRSILKEQVATRHAILHQTKLMEQNKKAPKEAADGPQGPRGITWQEAARTLRDICENQDCCDDCVAREWCDKALPVFSSASTPNCWEVPADE